MKVHFREGYSASQSTSRGVYDLDVLPRVDELVVFPSAGPVQSAFDVILVEHILPDDTRSDPARVDVYLREREEVVEFGCRSEAT